MPRCIATLRLNITIFFLYPACRSNISQFSPISDTACSSRFVSITEHRWGEWFCDPCDCETSTAQCSRSSVSAPGVSGRLQNMAQHPASCTAVMCDWRYMLIFPLFFFGFPFCLLHQPIFSYPPPRSQSPAPTSFFPLFRKFP